MGGISDPRPLPPFRPIRPLPPSLPYIRLIPRRKWGSGVTEEADGWADRVKRTNWAERKERTERAARTTRAELGYRGAPPITPAPTSPLGLIYRAEVGARSRSGLRRHLFPIDRGFFRSISLSAMHVRARLQPCAGIVGFGGGRVESVSCDSGKILAKHARPEIDVRRRGHSGPTSPS